MPRGNTSVSNIVREIVESDPCLVEALSNGYVNYSKLSERLAEVIREEYGVSCTPSSIKMSLLRSRSSVARQSLKSRIFRVLARSSIELKTGLAIVTYDYTVLHKVFKSVHELAGRTRFISISQGIDNITIIVNTELLDDLVGLMDKEPVWLERDVSAIIIVSPIENIETPGFISYITTLLARKGINILQIMSAHSDTIIVIDRKDSVEAFKTLELIILKAKEDSMEPLK
ncbi:ACT domain-containing protein [Desulfurococcus amylolyticus]|uniref:Aspartate kinase n=1 Tax=Desulfurococcus amylolyticus DSM 16532 TaxID=768672 RepID=I3XS96_DESAM|nr:ACT domain-containing protein [Desulfurococcus amylolyticus]AFL66820.1 aspartate kinase [Desulfurococcus amylolyticus DSM 16532]